jgi:hypothetical protein
MSAPTPTRHRRPRPAFRERPTREQIAELPPFDPLPLERIVVVETAEQAEAALRAMTHARFVGFDTESKPTFSRDAVRDGPHVIQFATGDQGFIVQVGDRTPIAFLREVLESEAIVKVTAPEALIRNRKSRPDDWEAAIIRDKLLRPDWPKGQMVTELGTSQGRSAFRFATPEYYAPSCLSCHGAPKGQIDITGYPKEGASDGDLGGVISVTLFRR